MGKWGRISVLRISPFLSSGLSAQRGPIMTQHYKGTWEVCFAFQKTSEKMVENDFGWPTGYLVCVLNSTVT